MKNSIMLSSLVVLLISSAFAQSYDPQYVSSINHDTLVVKDDIEYGGSNTLSNLMVSDSLAPATRVYFLKAGGIYSCVNNPASSKTHKTIIMGPEQNLKTGSPAMPPPIISGAIADPNVTGGMNINKDLLVKNINFSIGNTGGGSGGWAFFNFGGDSLKLQVDNCILEHTWWCWVGGPPAMQTIKFTNDYFVNLNGHSCRNNGGVVDFNSGSAFKQDTLLVQNCTHVNTQGILYKFREGYVVNRAIFNHNNFIDCAGYVIMNYGDQTNFSITNNIYVNCQLQAHYIPFGVWDGPNPDTVEMGLVNLLVDSTFTANVGTHGVYVDKNLTYWDPSLSNIVSTLNTNQVNGSTEWVSQMITMNARTAALFADDENYPNLINGTWINKLPAFRETDVLFTDQLAVLKAYAIACVDTGYATPMPSWRQPGNDPTVYPNYIHADWPIPIDLSYTDADLLTAGLGGFPVGDLGWFPTEYAAWKAQEAAELAYIDHVLETGSTTSVSTTEQLPQEFQLEQNYPNPFNPSTVISYSLAKAGNVTLKVYNMLGQEVAALVNGYQAANSYDVNFNAASLSSGIYFYELRTGSSVSTKKMVLVK